MSFQLPVRVPSPAKSEGVPPTHVTCMQTKHCIPRKWACKHARTNAQDMHALAPLSPRSETRSLAHRSGPWSAKAHPPWTAAGPSSGSSSTSKVEGRSALKGESRSALKVEGRSACRCAPSPPSARCSCAGGPPAAPSA
eukprot:819903-Prymnesium_polylepis.2